MLKRAAPFVLLAALAACARPVAAPPVVEGPPPGIDGRYRGTARLVHGDRACPRSGPRVYELEHGQVTLAYSDGGRKRVPLTATVGPDGSIQASDGVGTLQGHVGNGLLEVTIASRQCEHRWTMHLIP